MDPEQGGYRAAHRAKDELWAQRNRLGCGGQQRPSWTGSNTDGKLGRRERETSSPGIPILKQTLKERETGREEWTWVKPLGIERNLGILRL